MNTISTAPNPSNRLPAPTFLVVAARAFLWIAWLLGLLLWVPRVERVFQNMNLKPPSTTELVMVLTHGTVPVGLLLVLVFVLLDGAVYYRLRRPVVRALWSGVMTVLPVIAMLFSAVAVSQPMDRVLEVLSQK